MSTKIKSIGILATALIFTACATTSQEDTFAQNQNLKQMTSEALQEVFDGNTFLWDDGSHVYYSDNKIRALDSKGEPMVGTISFANDLHCRSWGGKDKCSTVYDSGNNILMFFVDGKPDSSGGRGRIITGNPEKL